MSESSTKTKKAATTKKTSSKKTAQKHDLLYIMSNSCGWCKKANPIVEELVKEGHKITTLDVMNPDESNRANELKTKYNAQCGTPFFIDAETGNSVCGFREKDVLEKWVKGEEIPKPPQPKGPPPPPPQDLENDAQVKEFTTKYEQWAKENDHLPNLLTIEQVLERLKNSRAQQGSGAGNPAGGQPGAPATKTQGMQMPTGGAGNDDYVPVFTQDFYYIVNNGAREVVVTDPGFLTGLKQQYYYRETNGNLTKVVGDVDWTRKINEQSNTARPAGGRQGQPRQHPGQQQAVAAKPQSKQVDKAVKDRISQVKKESEQRKKVAETKSSTSNYFLAK